MKRAAALHGALYGACVGAVGLAFHVLGTGLALHDIIVGSSWAALGFAIGYGKDR